MRALRRSLRLLLWLSCGVACTHPVELPSYGPLPAFSLQDQNGRTVSAETLKGHVVVADFIFTHCPDVCPLLTEDLRSLRTHWPEHTSLRLLSFSVDPEHDTPERLRAFAQQHGALRDDWWFLTGPLDEVRRVVTQGFKQAMQAEPEVAGRPPNVLHGTHFVLVDAHGEIRGFYANDPAGHAALQTALSSLLPQGKTS
jgi:protein SCO1/2